MRHRGTNFKLEVTSKNIFDALCSYIWTRYIIVLFVIIVLNRVIGHEVTNVLIIVVPSLLVIGAIPYMLKKLKMRDILAYLGFAAVYILSMMFSEYRVSEYLSGNLFDTLIRFAPLYFLGICIRDEETVKKMHTVSIVSIFINVLFIIVASPFLNEETDQMSFSYYILPHICLALFYAAKDKKMIDVAAAFAGFICIIVFGTRGPLLALALIFLFYFLFYKKYKHRIVGRILALVIIVGFYFLALWFLFFYGASLSKLVLRTNIINNLSIEGFFFDNGRFDIAESVWKRLVMDPFAIRGLAADRVLTNSYGEVFHYSHNLFLELLYSFGAIGGGLAIFNCVFVYIRGIVKCGNRAVKGVILTLLASTGFFKLMISSSFLLEPSFFLLIGICVGSVRIAKKETDDETRLLHI